MHLTNECDSLLVESDTVSRKFARAASRDAIPDTKLTRSLIYKRSATKPKKNVSFSCRFFEYLINYNSELNRIIGSCGIQECT